MLNDPPRPETPQPKTQPAAADTSEKIAAETPATAPGEPAPASSLTPEEQMARFAKELKENDWGHQPC